MKITEVPHTDIKSGDKVISRRGRPGVITYAAMERWFAVSVRWSTEPPWDNSEQTESHFYLYGNEEPSERYMEYVGQ